MALTAPELFRLCLANPFPVRPFRVIGVSQTFFIPAPMSSLDEMSAGKLLQACLVDENRKPIFKRDPSTMLSSLALKSLSTEVARLQNELAPTRFSSLFDAWHAKLKQGAKHHSNFYACHALGECFDLNDLGIVDHPERYFGCGLKDLSDLNWEAYWVCREISIKARIERNKR